MPRTTACSRPGDITFEYNADGFLTSKTVDGETTTYTYASTGELLAVGLPDGSTIAYENDALGRRVAKYINGAKGGAQRRSRRSASLSFMRW